jgi:hypothetical protein
MHEEGELIKDKDGVPDPVPMWKARRGKKDDVDFHRCFSSACSVAPGHDVKCPLLMAFINVDFTGLKHAACR